VTADPVSGQTRTLLMLTDPDWLDVNNDLYFLKSGGFIWSTDQDGWHHLIFSAMTAVWHAS
jgi:Dipeptidyl peptidase IV (DPP IV) N-terminal region.